MRGRIYRIARSKTSGARSDGVFFKKESQESFFGSIRRTPDKEKEPVAEKKKKTIAEENGITSRQLVKDGSTLAVIDKMFEASQVLKGYVDPKKNPIAEKGKFKVEYGYESLLSAYKKCGHSDKLDGKIGGFFCRNTGVIHTVEGFNGKERTAEFGNLIHEAVHKKSAAMLASIFTPFVNEGVTQYFADKILEEQGLGAYKRHEYNDQLECATHLVRVAGIDEVAKFYFTGKGSLLDTLNKKLGSELQQAGLKVITDAIRKDPSPKFFCTMLKNKQ